MRKTVYDLLGFSMKSWRRNRGKNMIVVSASLMLELRDANKRFLCHHNGLKNCHGQNL